MLQGLLHSEMYAEALTVFVNAAATSPFCLEVLEAVTDKLVYALNLVLHNHMRKHGHSPMPHVWYEASYRQPCALYKHKTLMLLHGVPSSSHLHMAGSSAPHVCTELLPCWYGSLLLF